MRKANFFHLSRQLQERFIASAAGVAVPSPLLRAPPRVPFPVRWVLAGLVCLLLLAFTLRAGFGEVESRLALAPPYMIVVYGVALWLVLLTGVAAFSVMVRWRSLPFQPGTYLFPIGVVDARSSRLDVYPVDELERTSVLKKPLRMQLAFKSGRSFELPIQDPERAQAVLDALANVQARLLDPSRPTDSRERALLDPLADPGMPTPLLSESPLVNRVPAWARSMPVLLLVLAVALAWPAYLVRNLMSERAMGRVARQADTPAAYQAYLAAGGSDPEIAGVLLPRAELRAAKGIGSVEAIEQVLARFGGSPARVEIEVALREALLAELEAAKRKGSVTALRDLERRRKGKALINAELRRAIRDVYAASAKRFRAEVAPAKAEVLTPLVDRMLADAERNGPRVDVRFIRHQRASVPMLDQRIVKSPYFRGEPFRPAQYFDAAHSAPREARLGALLIEAWQQPFPKDVLDFELGPALEAKDSSWPAVDRPTLFVRHSTLFGGTFRTTNPDGIYVGVGVVFDVSLRMPGESKGAGFMYSAWRPPDTDEIEAEKLGPAELYERLTMSAFEECATRYLAATFRKH